MPPIPFGLSLRSKACHWGVEELTKERTNIINYIIMENGRGIRVEGDKIPEDPLSNDDLVKYQKAKMVVSEFTLAAASY